MGPKVLSLVSRCCKILLLFIPQGPMQALQLPQPKKPGKEQAPPLLPAKAASIEKRDQEKNWQAGRQRGSMGTAWGCCQRRKPFALPQALAHPGQRGAVGAAVGPGCYLLTLAHPLVRCPEMHLIVPQFTPLQAGMQSKPVALNPSSDRDAWPHPAHARQGPEL